MRKPTLAPGAIVMAGMLPAGVADVCCVSKCKALEN